MKYRDRKCLDSGVFVGVSLKVLKNPRREISRGRIRIVVYKRINTAFLTPQWILKRYQEKNVKAIPIVYREGDYIVFKHKDNPSFYLNLQDGKLYYLTLGNVNLEDVNKTASIFLELIRERVEGFNIIDKEPRIKFHDKRISSKNVKKFLNRRVIREGSNTEIVGMELDSTLQTDELFHLLTPSYLKRKEVRKNDCIRKGNTSPKEVKEWKEIPSENNQRRQ